MSGKWSRGTRMKKKKVWKRRGVNGVKREPSNII